MIEIGSKVDGRYRIMGRIAHGGMADVYEAYDVVLRLPVALKLMRSDMMGKKENLERFRRECIAAASLNNPYIVKVYGSGEIDGRPYMANEYVDGRTVRDKLNMTAGHSLSALESCEIMLQLTSGVSYIHSHGLVHRDLKPDNIFYLADGSIKISDFGIATRLGERAEGDRVPGTIFYTAPETLLSGTAIVQSDIYSMGIVFFELLTGRVPFDAGRTEEVALAHINKRMPEPSAFVPSVPRSLDRIVLKATRKRPQDRYRSSEDMRLAIEEALKSGNDFQERRGFFSRLFGFK